MATIANELNLADHAPQSPTSRRRAALLAGMNGYNISTDLPLPVHVRALFDYHGGEDQTSLSFRRGDIITVITQLDSGWWDGYLNNVRGWFPSNYCRVMNEHELDEINGETDSDLGVGSGTEEDYDTDSDTHTQDDESEIEGDGRNQDKEEDEAAAVWMPQATPDGRVFYFNTRTGVSATTLPLEVPFTQDRGPALSSNFHIPAQTRAPPDLPSEETTDEEDFEPGHGSETTSSHRQSQQSLKDGPPLEKTDTNNTLVGTSFAPNGTTATSFSVPANGQSHRILQPKYFADNSGVTTLSWEILVGNMEAAIESYCQAVRNDQRSEYVRRAENISDHLRSLLAAGSGTTDNHSGYPSIIAGNKALYPHFREMMSKFSKLVLASNMAAADWPGPESGTKCLREAEGVLLGAINYAEVARQQRGNEICRLTPGFVAEGFVGGNWSSNNIESLSSTDSIEAIKDSKLPGHGPRVKLDPSVLRVLEEGRSNMSVSIRKLEEQLQIRENVITPGRQMLRGDSICMTAGAIIDQFRSWIALIESVDLGSSGTVFEKPSLLDFAGQKQKVYDSIAELVMTCQDTTLPLPDEWSDNRGETLESRYAAVRAACESLDSHVAQINYSLQLLEPASGTTNSKFSNARKEHRMTAPSDMEQTLPVRLNSTDRPRLGEIGQSKSYNLNEPKSRRQSRDKPKEIFGHVPQILNNESDPTQVDERPFYLRLEHENEVHYDFKAVPLQVKSGTLAGLVEQLTRHDRADGAFQATFLLTYRSFISAAELFQMLVQRFNIQPPPGLNREEMLVWTEQKQGPIRFRVVNTMHKWIEQYWMEGDDAESQSLLGRMNGFAKNVVTNARIPGGAPLATAIEMRMKGQDASAKKLVLTLTGSAPVPIVPKNMKKLKFLDIDPLEFARQLTIIESRLYGRIKPVECLEKIWERKDTLDGIDRAPHVRALILHSNRITNCIAEMILQHSEVKKRMVIIKHAVLIADKCRSLNNFSSLTSIVSALGTAPILRLNRTWLQVPQKTKDMLENMRTLISSSKNFANYRGALSRAQTPCIPFLGVYLTDLTFIEDGIASIVKNTALVNFTKRTKTAEVIRGVQAYQSTPYNLTEVPELRDWILENSRTAADVHGMYNKSLAIEPREKEEEKIARLLSESGFL